MNEQSGDIVIRYIKIKSKIRKIVSYRSNDCKLRIYHSKVSEFLNSVFVNSKFSKAYTKNQSIYHNAKAHMYNDDFLMLDIADFFQSINHNTLLQKLYFEANRLNKENIKRVECARLIEQCSISNKGIPLGFITSPILSNIYLKEFDGIIYGQLRRLELSNVIYTRYADDICISFKHKQNYEEVMRHIISYVRSILGRYHLKLNDRKTRFYSLTKANHIKITGINIVQDNMGYRKITVGKKAKNKLFWDAIRCIMNSCTGDKKEAKRIKGMQSFILSVEKNGYETDYSEKMCNLIHSYGYMSLKELIDSL